MEMIRHWLLRYAVIPATLFAGSAAAPSVAHAQARAKGSAAQISDCGSGVTLRLSASGTVQGGLLQVEARSASPFSDLKADWDGHAVPLWTETKPEATRYKDVREGFIPVDLEREPGSYELKLDARLTSGESVSCTAAVSVRPAHFAVEKLTVAPQFVEPNPQEAERVNREGQRQREILATTTPEPLWRGPFRLPLAARDARNAKNFGRRRVLNGQPRAPHTGVDFPAPAGTPILAAQRGRVVLAENLFFSGNTVILDHGLGVYTFYGHMESIAVKEGDLVARGALLGHVGSTGRVTGPHLHWGLTINQARVNPLAILGLPQH
jgi:murein DD-endopeptidase MepM/ murein hydrolase activator NlpD